MSTLPPWCSRGSVRESSPGSWPNRVQCTQDARPPASQDPGRMSVCQQTTRRAQVHAIIPPPGMSYTLLVPVPSPPGQCMAMRLACSPPTPLSWRRLSCYYLRHFDIGLVFHLGSARLPMVRTASAKPNRASSGARSDLGTDVRLTSAHHAAFERLADR